MIWIWTTASGCRTVCGTQVGRGGAVVTPHALPALAIVTAVLHVGEEGSMIAVGA